MPPHRGHDYLIQFARARVSRLTLLLFSKTHEPIPGALRQAWLRELYPRVQVFHLTDEGPVDFGDETAWAFWTACIRRVVPRGPDLVFSSEGYGAELARRLGAQHIAVDVDRVQVPVSATRIRNDPHAHWEFLSPPVRAYYATRVCLVGAESTGKTTLAQHLARHLQTVWNPEFAREYLAQRNGVCARSDMLPIARGQIAREDATARAANHRLVCDTNLLTTRLWSEYYWGECDAEIIEMERVRNYDLFLLTDCDVPWQADALRDAPQARAWFHARYLQELNARHLPFRVISGDLDARMRVALEVIHALK